MIVVVRRLSMLAVLLATLVLAVSSPAGAAAMPPRQRQLDHHPGHLRRPARPAVGLLWGNTAFLVGGSVLVGKIFTAIDLRFEVQALPTSQGG